MVAGSQSMLELALAVSANNQQPDRETCIRATEQHVGPHGDVEQLWREPPYGERADRRGQRGAPPRQPRAFSSHRCAPRLIQLRWRHLAPGPLVCGARLLTIRRGSGCGP